MFRIVILTIAAALAGCGPLPVQVSEQERVLACPANHTVSCDFVPGQRRPDPDTCVCVHNSRVSRMFSRY